MARLLACMRPKTTHGGIRDNARDPDVVAFYRKRCSGVLQRARQNPVSSGFLQIWRSRALTGKPTWRGAHDLPRAISTAAKPRELRRALPCISVGGGGGLPAALRLASSAGEGGGRPTALRLAFSAGPKGEAGEGYALFAGAKIDLASSPTRTSCGCPSTSRRCRPCACRMWSREPPLYLAIWHEHDGPARARSEKARHEHGAARCR
jgi:hypothetical protein